MSRQSRKSVRGTLYKNMSAAFFLVHACLKFLAFSDRLRQPDNLSRKEVSQKLQLASCSEETHGFAPLPRGRFAFIVCNHRFAKDQRYH